MGLLGNQSAKINRVQVTPLAAPQKLSPSLKNLPIKGVWCMVLGAQNAEEMFIKQGLQ